MFPPQCLLPLNFDAVKAKAKTRAFPPDQHFPKSKAVPLCVLQGRECERWKGGVKGRGLWGVKGGGGKSQGKQNQGKQQEIYPCTGSFSPGASVTTSLFLFWDSWPTLLPWMGVWGGVHINAHKSISGSLEPQSKGQKTHIYLNYRHHFHPCDFICGAGGCWGLQIPVPVSLESIGNVPAERLPQASMSQVLYCQDPDTKIGESKLPLFIVW